MKRETLFVMKAQKILEKRNIIRDESTENSLVFKSNYDDFWCMNGQGYDLFIEVILSKSLPKLHRSWQ